jgi:DHA2 family multidrug resistance protein
MAGTLSTDVDFGTVVRLRIYQSAGLAFLFIPINVIAYAGVPKEKNNRKRSPEQGSTSAAK